MTLDHCTGWFEAWWAEACRLHDLDYAGQVGKALADDRLFQNVAASLPAWADTPLEASVVGVVSFAMAGLMRLGVGILGGRYYRRAGAQKDGRRQ